MPFAIALPNQFNLKSEVSAGEALTALTLLSILGGATYNIGYFSVSNVGYVSLLSVQDMIIGVAFAALAITASFISLRATFYWFRISVSTKNVWAVIVITAVFYAISIALFFYLPPAIILNAFSALMVAFLLTFALIQRAIKKDWFVLLSVVSISMFLLWAVGMSTFLSAANGQSERSRAVLSDGVEAPGRIVRVTSGYVFILAGAELRVVPLARISTMIIPLSTANPTTGS
jgi:hypothetical protein